MRPPSRLPVARELGETSLMFLVHPTLSEPDLLDASHAVRKVLDVAVKDEYATQDKAQAVVQG